MLNKVFDIMPDETDAEKLESLNGFSMCEDYLLDMDSEDSITNLECDSSQRMRKIGSFPADQDAYNGTPRRSGSSGATYRVKDCQEGLHMNDSGGIFSCTAESEMIIGDRWFKCPTSFMVENIAKLEDVSSMFAEDDKDIIFNPGLTSGEAFCSLITKQEKNGHSSVGQNTNMGSILVQCTREVIPVHTHANKRLRKPPQRLIDELLETDVKSFRRKGEVSDALPKGRSRQVSQKQSDISGKEKSRLDDSAGKAIQVPFAPLICKGSQKPEVPISKKALCSEQVASVSASMEDSGAVLKSVDECGRRKHHILFSLSEVRKLIDGVSQYGVGRWSRIKKEFFASSTHRTPVDLKDKWRNLLKATSVQRQSKKGEDRKRNLAWRPLPKSDLLRVRELAITYPYPRDLRSRH